MANDQSTSETLTTTLDADRVQTLSVEKLPDPAAQLAGGLAHVVRNPLAIIQMGLDNMARRLPRDPAGAQQFESDIRSAILRIESIVSKLLQYGAPAPINISETDLHQAIEDSRCALAPLFEERGITFGVSADPDSANVLFDGARLREVLRHLFSNAVDAMPNGGRLTVTVTRQNEGDKTGVAVDIQDTGPGLPPEKGEEVCRPFFTTKYDRLGLGLAVDRAVLEQHGGAFSIDTSPEGGARVRMLISDRRPTT